MKTLSNNPEDHTMKKTFIFSIAFLLLIGLTIPFSANAEDFEYKTALVIKETKTYSPPPSTMPPAACDGITVGTPNALPASANTPYDVYRVLKTPDDFTKVSFRVFKTDGPEVKVDNYINKSPGDVSYDSETGQITFTLKDIEKSRKSYTVKLYLNSGGTGTPLETKEFYTSQANTAPPIGTIIPYYGTAVSAEALNMGGWFLCDGKLIDNISPDILFDDEKDALKAVVGLSLPDLRGLFLRGIDPNGTYDVANRGVGDYQASFAAATAHTHNYEKATSTNNSNVTLNQSTSSVSNTTSNVTVLNTGTSLGGGNHSHSLNYSTVATESSGGGGSTDTRPANRAVNYLIKVRK
jgi:microcystin-dependent protein